MTGPRSISGSESYALLTLGTGFVFNSRFSLNPSISIPVGADGVGNGVRFDRCDPIRQLTAFSPLEVVCV